MLEIAANNASDTKLVDGTTQHLSSVNDHRVALSSVDPTTNSAKFSIDWNNGSKCGDEKQTTYYRGLVNCTQDARTDDKQVKNAKTFHTGCLVGEEVAFGDNEMPVLSSAGTCLVGQKIEELGNVDQSSQPGRMSPKANGADLIGTKDVKTRCKVGKRKKRVQWTSEYSRRQKNPKRLPRSEMPHDELLKLREKERKAQQLRRERLKRAEEMRIQLLKQKKVNIVAKTAGSSLGDAPLADREEGDSTFETDENTLQLTLQRHKTSEARSVAEFLANNIVTTAGIESNIFNSVNGEESCFQSHASRRSVCELGTEKSYQSLSEETSDSSEKRTNSDGLSRKTRRSSLSKEDLDRLREKERLAKRRQRAKNKKDFESGRPFAIQCERNGDFKEISEPSTFDDKGNDSTDTESIADSKSNNDNGESSSCADNTEEHKTLDSIVEERKEVPLKQSDGKRKAFPRYYDRSMLSAEELESLRRREREYQRRRRARLREAKFKAIGELRQEDKSLSGSRTIGTREPGITDDSSKKYETRMSKGISCPSLRFLEHNSVFYSENECNEGKAIVKEESSQSDWKSNEEKHYNDYTSPISIVNKTTFVHDTEDQRTSDTSNLELGIESPYKDRHVDSDYTGSVIESTRNQWESPISNFPTVHSSPITEQALKRPSSVHIGTGRQDVPHLVDCEVGFNDLKSQGGQSFCNGTPAVPFSVRCGTSMVDALYSSDCKILEANGYRRAEADKNYRYCDAQKLVRRTCDMEWSSKTGFSKDAPECVIEQNGTLCDKGGLDYDSDMPKRIKEERSEIIKVNLKKGSDPCVNNKWRHWKSGLSDSQLQRRRQSNREAQRRRRMRLRLQQMKSLQEQDQISFEEIMYKRFAPNKRVIFDDAMKAFNVSKSKLKSMLERRQKVFIDAQIEKSRSETEFKMATIVDEEQPKKGRGCRVKVTPKRQVIVPCMGFPSDVDISERAGPTNDDACFTDFQVNEASDNRFSPQPDEFANRCFGSNATDYEESKSPEVEEQTGQTSSRKRKQFCPRRLLTEKERSRRDIVPSLVTAL